MSVMRLLPLVEAVAGQLRAAGIDAERGLGQGTLDPFDEAAWLVLWSLDLPLDSDLQALGGRSVSEPEIARVQNLVRRRIDERRPTAYLTQQAWLVGFPFYVDERAIIPRSFIAELMTDATLDLWLGEHTRRVLDLCTGNGSLAVIAALTYPEVQVEGADLCADALEVARINVDQHGLADRITLIQSNGMDRCHGPYDLIVCNPPYVNAASMARLPPEFRAEPALALAGGEDGMDFIRILLRQASSRMCEKAVLVLEVGHERNHFERAFPDLAPVWLETSAGSDQVLLLEREQLLAAFEPPSAR
jgi:ribosomal protein L3 glutamine methyltransferase